ncbi:hypothetical protein BDR04DRAFT_1093898 [Suillus decipiens]|nr:hypothetical protein BDR04DRAFT_1093898 [Suillus decipiens]
MSAIIGKFRGARLQDGNLWHSTSLLLSPLRGPGLPQNTDAHIHTDFLYAFRSVGDIVLNVLREQFGKFPQYDVAVSGHSLGVYRTVPLYTTYAIVLEQGAIACIAALSIRNTFPDGLRCDYSHLVTYPVLGYPCRAMLLNMTVKSAKDRGSLIR